MADTKLSDLTELAASPAIGDEIYIRDISEAASAESKRITWSNLFLNADLPGTLSVTGATTLDSTLSVAALTTLSVAGNTFIAQNTTDAISNQVGILGGGNRGTPADNDEAYITFNLDDSTGTQVEFARLTWKALDVTNTTKDSRPEFQYYTANTLREVVFPPITADDTVAVLAFAQTLTNKTINANNNTIINIGSSEIEIGIITGHTELSAGPAETDEILISDAGAFKKINAVELLNPENFTAVTLPAAADELFINDSGTGKKITHDDLLFGANGTPSTQAHGDSTAIGVALDAARSDHKHAMPSASSGRSVSGDTDNAVVTWVTSDNTFAAEANLTFDGTNLTVGAGDVIIGTAGKGIDFSAQASPSAGMTAELLDRYEEGTWTAKIQGSAGSEGENYAVTGQGNVYTRIGRMVTVYTSIRATNAEDWTGTMRIAGLPFTNGGIGAAGSVGMLSSSALDGTVRACHIPASAAYIEFKAGSYLDGGMNLSEYHTSYNTQVNVTYFV